MAKKQQLRDFFYFNCEYVLQFILITLEMQLFLSCIYIPILTYWGLSWPVLSIMSTPLFTPLFILFLIVSLTIFVNALFSSTVFSFFIMLLEWITATWVCILNSPPLKYQLGFCVPPLIFLLLLPCVGLYIVNSVHHRGYRIFYLTASIGLFYGITVVTRVTKPNCQIIQTDRGFFHFVSCNGKKIIVDSRSWKKAMPYPSWFFYTLMPAITKVSGAVEVDIWIILSHKKNFSRFVDAIAIISPQARIFTHEKNYAQVNFQQSVKNINHFDEVFLTDQMHFVMNDSTIAIYFQENIVFQTFIA